LSKDIGVVKNLKIHLFLSCLTATFFNRGRW